MGILKSIKIIKKRRIGMYDNNNTDLYDDNISLFAHTEEIARELRKKGYSVISPNGDTLYGQKILTTDDSIFFQEYSQKGIHDENIEKYKRSIFFKYYGTLASISVFFIIMKIFLGISFSLIGLIMPLVCFWKLYPLAEEFLELSMRESNVTWKLIRNPKYWFPRNPKSQAPYGQKLLTYEPPVYLDLNFKK